MSAIWFSFYIYIAKICWEISNINSKFFFLGCMKYTKYQTFAILHMNNVWFILCGLLHNPREYSALLLTFINLPFVVKTFVFFSFLSGRLRQGLL